MGCTVTVTRSKLVRNIAEEREEFSQNNSMAEEGDRESDKISNVVQDMQEERNEQSPRTVADFSWLSCNKAEQSAAQKQKALRLE